ncbi:MAG: hypothetical protein D4R77_10220, partial [Planctomycetaceae bacterium]
MLVDRSGILSLSRSTSISIIDSSIDKKSSCALKDNWHKNTSFGFLDIHFEKEMTDGISYILAVSGWGV